MQKQWWSKFTVLLGLMVFNNNIPSVEQFPQFAMAAEEHGITLQGKTDQGRGRGHGRTPGRGRGRARGRGRQPESAHGAAAPADGAEPGARDAPATDAGQPSSTNSSGVVADVQQSAGSTIPEEHEPCSNTTASTLPNAQSAKAAVEEAEARAAAQQEATAQSKAVQAFYSLCQGALLTLASPEARFLSHIMDFLIEPLAKAHTRYVKQLTKGNFSCQELLCKVARGERCKIVWEIQAACSSTCLAGKAGLKVTDSGEVTVLKSANAAKEDDEKAIKIDNLSWHLCSQVVRGQLPATLSVVGLMGRTMWDRREQEERLVLQAFRDYHSTWLAATSRKEPEVQKILARTDWASGPLERWILLAAAASDKGAFSPELQDVADDLAQAKKSTDMIENAFKELREREKRCLHHFWISPFFHFPE